MWIIKFIENTDILYTYVGTFEFYHDAYNYANQMKLKDFKIELMFSIKDYKQYTTGIKEK